jgi:hypothetical protein
MREDEEPVHHRQRFTEALLIVAAKLYDDVQRGMRRLETIREADMSPNFIASSHPDGS